MAFKSSKGRDVGKEIETWQSSRDVLGQPLSGGAGGGETLTKGEFTFTSGPLTGIAVTLRDNTNYSYAIDTVGAHEITFNDSFSINMEVIGGGGGGAGGGGGTSGGGGQQPANPGSRGQGLPSTVVGPVAFGNVISGGGLGGSESPGVGGVATVTQYAGPTDVWTSINGVSGGQDPSPGTGGGTGEFVIVEKHDVYYGYNANASECSSGKSGTRSAGGGPSGPGGGGGQGAYLLGQNIPVQAGDTFTLQVGSGGNGTAGQPNQSAGGSGGYGRPGNISIQVYLGDD